MDESTILEILAWIFVYIPYGTGEVLLFLGTLGRRRIRWRVKGALNALKTPSFWIGWAFWVAVIVAFALAF